MPDLIKAGDLFPRLTLDQRGVPFKVSPGRGGALVYFMRTAECPVCRAHVKRLAALHDELGAAGFSIAVVVPEPGSATEVASSAKAPFPVVTSRDAHRDVGLKRVFLGTLQQSGTAMLDAGGAVLALFRSTLPTGAFPEDDVLELVQRARAPQAVPATR